MEEYDLIIDEKFLSERLGGVSLSSFRPESADFERKTKTHPLRNGIITPKKNNRGRFKERKITVRLNISVSNSEQFYLLRGDLFRLFKRKDPYYVGHTYEPNKRWLVVCDDTFSVVQEEDKPWATVDITLTAIQGLSESLYNTSQNINLIDKHWDIGMNVELVDDPIYKFKNKNKFIVYNLGDETLDPMNFKYNVEMYLEGKDIIIANETNGTSVTLVGSQSKKNKLSLFEHYVLNGSTIVTTKNGRFPPLEPGRNVFTIKNASYSDIRFITHFYYL
ncbi:phage tail domain-containing protein [Bacillus sp. SDLI1]|uniref:phage tail domain-containing protein n=1 Tax=Bacillus sp. SDLI1 TaxID=1774743 RepID=UPI0007684214|nr:phage tail domain-containing protein [Bacillus sp. SDLI1]AME05015.1 phage tail protein [Bacillus sp. SDLI1]